MSLFKPAWKSQDSRKTKKALKEIERISDQKLLLEIALTAPAYDVVTAAIDKLTDEELLYIVSVKSREVIYRGMAVEKISNPDFIKRIVINADKNTPYPEYIKKINDKQALIEIAQKANDPRAGLLAALELNDPDMILEYAFHPDASIRYEARKEFELRFIGKLRWYKNIEITKSQFDKYIDSLIAEEYGGYRIGIPLEIERSDVERIYKNASLETLRAGAFRKMISDDPIEKLIEDYKEACANCEALDIRKRADWSEVISYIERTIDNKIGQDYKLILNLIETPELGFDVASRGVKQLFSDSLNDLENIDDIRKKGVDIYISRIPGFISSGEEEKNIIWSLAMSIPESEREKYGIELHTYDDESEDQYGRYTTHSWEIRYKGKTYRVG